MAKMKKCPVCAQTIKLENLERHIKRVHPKEKAEVKYTRKEEKILKEHKLKKKELEKPIGLWKLGTIMIVVIVIGVAAVTFLYPSTPGGSGVIPLGTNLDELDFTVTDTDGNTVTLSDWKGEIIYLDFIQTACSNCQKNTQYVLVPIYQNYSQIKMLSVSINSQDTNQDLLNFKATYGAQWQFALDTADAQHLYGLDVPGSGTPKGFLFNRNGELVYQHQGLSTYAALSAEINKIL